MRYRQHYAKLFEVLESAYGKLDDATVTAVIGFSAGGPVSLRKREASQLFVTCELSVYEEQKLSADGIKFEFLSKDDFDQKQARVLFTALGRLSMEDELGNNHTIDVAQIALVSTDTVGLHLFSRVMIEGVAYGLYRVRPVRQSL
jgi:hypothetical protein